MTNIDADRIVWDRRNWFYFTRWVDNNTLLAIDHESEINIFRTLFLDPIIREEHVFLLEDMPNYMAHHWGGAVILTHYLDGEVIPDPTMRMIISPELADEPGVFATNTLWDVENRRPLAWLRHLVSDFNGPLWSQDGCNLLMIGPNPELRETTGKEWFFIKANGAVRQVTQFQDIFLDTYYSIYHPSRSWDGRFLVFNYKEPVETDKHIVLDVKSNTIEGYCIPSPGRNSSFDGAVWSPDSKYIILSGEDDDGKMDNILVDVENKIAYLIAQDALVIGWIEKP